MTRTETADIETFLSYRLSIVSRLINRRSTRYFTEKHGLTLAEWRALAQIAAGRATSVQAIAARTCSDKGQISRAIATLLDKGLITSLPDTNDRRLINFDLTAAGAAIHDEILPMRAEENAMIAGLMSEEELTLFHDVLDRIQARLD
ncbi:MarR family winged helix-turn-helix transcriptional regulator [Niveispirillum sp. KHB5.9]|uniref:MarR family winged helix-turn-helix transcriptional regulator n=1 Tax=Niveispirillum sp. KHB5.9 TaxID=3400269 RepID=UPI003A8BFB58